MSRFREISFFFVLIAASLSWEAVAMEPAPSPRLLPPVAEGVPLASDDACDSSIILPVAFNQPQLFRSVTGAAPARFRLPRYARSSPQRLPNNFTAFPEFDGGIIIVGEKAAMKIGGYVKGDLIHDFDAIDSKDFFDTSTIPTTGPQRKNSRFHARQSRINFDTRWRIEDNVVRTYVEGDFFGADVNGNNAFRLRHAFGSFGRFTAGQTWTTFTDPAAVPQTLDFEGAVSNVNRRGGLVRWTQPLVTEGLTLAVALEDPRIQVEVPSMLQGAGRTESPDLVAHLRWEQDWGQLQGALVSRKLGFQPTGNPVISAPAWGFNFTGSLLLTDWSRVYYQVTFGDGIGSYRGSPDVVATGPDTAAVMPMFGWMIGTKVEWNDSLTSNFTFSKLSLDDLPGQDPRNMEDTTYLAVNLISNPYERVFCGVEYLYGIREDAGGATGHANRLQMSFGFFLP